MNLLEEIREALAAVQTGKAIELNMICNAPAWVVKEKNWYGVAIDFPYDIPVYEKFANVKLWTETLIINGVRRHLLLLTTHRAEFRYEFSSICAEFCDPGEDNSRRNHLLSNPVQWWNNWRSLLGNTLSEKKAYSVIGEMIIFSELLKRDSSTKWTALNQATHDIVSGKRSYEVKSTIKRYESIVKINSLYQLAKDNEFLSIVFCRFELAPKGYSINSMVEHLVSLGCVESELEISLSSFGFDYGMSIRDLTFKLLEVSEFPIDDAFPKITRNSFKMDDLPLGIESITYDVNLGVVQNKKNFIIDALKTS